MEVDRSSLEKLRKQMRNCNLFFHFTRNNPRARERFYHQVIGTVGYDNWKNVDPIAKNAWESARYDFDKMYGLVKAWVRSDRLFKIKDGPDENEIISKLKEKAANLEEEIEKIKKNYETKANEYSAAIKELSGATEVMKKAMEKVAKD